MSISFNIFSILVASLRLNHENGQLVWAQITEDLSRPDDSVVYSVILAFYDGSQTEHRFVFFNDEEGSKAYDLAHSSPYFKEWNYEDYID